MNPFELPEWLASPGAEPAEAMSGPPLIDPTILVRNLRALAHRSPGAASAIGAAAAAGDVAFSRAQDGAWTATRRESGEGATTIERQLASARRPLVEASKLAEAVPVESAGGFVLLGFGLGHHAAALAARIGRSGVIFAFEPDVPMLRAVLERVDHSAWIAASNFALFVEAEDPAAISAASQGVEGLLAMGVKFVDHPTSKQRLGEASGAFSRSLAGVMRALRTTIVTTLVQVDTTLRNTLMNLDRYANAPGIGELAGTAAGIPAVVVAAGPSLERNLHELSRPGLRDRVVVIAVQTVLKTMLERGIVPHFVTALDHAELSARFYEGLTAADVEGCTLVVQAMANPAIFQAFPGEIRCPGDDLSDRTLGDLQTEPRRASRGQLRPGATVAHMAYYLARHLGCDPVILVGQDLGFTDGQYYSANAAIHRVWSSELSDFNSIEMMEWQRIVRSKSMLHRATDVFGRPIFTDEQMTTYLSQFERDFAADARVGRSTVDATEGGVSKRHTHPMALRDALDRCVPLSGRTFRIPTSTGATESLSGTRVAARVRQVRREAFELAALSRSAIQKLEEMKDRPHEPSVVNRLISEVYSLRDRVAAQPTGYFLTQFLNQTGAFNRAKTDRAIELDRDQTAQARQQRQIERDIKNVTWLADAADEVGAMLDATVGAIKSGVKQTRPAQPRGDEGSDSAIAVTLGADHPGRPRVESPARPRVVAYLQVDPNTDGLGKRRDLSAPLALGLNALALTLRRLSNCREIDGVLIAASDPERVRAMLGPVPAAMGVKVERADGELMRSRGRSVGAARAFAAHAWRGGVGSMSVYDEACCPRVAAAALQGDAASALLVVGADWALVDPALCDALVVRYRENPVMNSLVFSQAPPGLAGCVIAASLVAELGTRQDEIGPIASIGGLLSYIPVAPLADPIAKPACVVVSPAVRDAGTRCVPDSGHRAERVRSLIERAAAGSFTLDAQRIVTELTSWSPTGTCRAGPDIVRLEITTRRVGSGARGGWLGSDGPGGAATEFQVDRARAILEEARALWPDAAVSFEGRGDPLLHPGWREIIGSAPVPGTPALHVRTDLGEGTEIGPLLEILGRDARGVLSVDLLATTPRSYTMIAGNDGFSAAVENTRRVIEARGMGAGLPVPWIVPRITRCDTVYGEIENFYDFWLMTAGAAAIDPLPRSVRGDRIAPLPLPESARARIRRTEIFVRADGTIATDLANPWASEGTGTAPGDGGLVAVWERQAVAVLKKDLMTTGRVTESSPVESLQRVG